MANTGHIHVSPDHTHPGGAGVDAGAIVMWSLLNGAIPTGWAECDGVANAPGPDLRDRFVVGRSGTRTVDTTSGASTHTHGGHSSHAGHGAHADHSAHVVTQPSAHVVTQASAHSDHADNIAHVHTQRYFPTATGASIGNTLDTSMSGTQTNTSLQTTSQGTGASLAHSAHAGGAVDAHTGTAVDIHSSHDPHTSHSAHSAHDTPNSEPPGYVLIYIQKL